MLLITTGLLFVLIVCQLGAAGGGGVVAEGAVDPGLGAIGAKAAPFNNVVPCISSTNNMGLRAVSPRLNVAKPNT